MAEHDDYREQAADNSNDGASQSQGEILHLQVQDITIYDDVPPLYGNQFFQTGDLVDMWADLIEGHASNAQAFWNAYSASFSNREAGARRQVQKLSSTGIFPPSREMEFVKRQGVTITVYVATQGRDLYVSWRAFIQAQISGLKIGLWIVICLLLALPFSFTEVVGNYYWETERKVNTSTLLILFVAILAVTGIWILLVGFFRRRGDFFSLLRKGLSELQIDEIIALSGAVHYSVLAAADKVGIDTTKLQAREPFYTSRQRQRRI